MHKKCQNQRNNYILSSEPIIFLLLFRDFDQISLRGEAYDKSVCTKYGLGLVDIGKNVSYNPFLVAISLCHELSHMMGFNHFKKFLHGPDDTQRRRCSCHDLDETYCLMYSVASYTLKSHPPHLDDCNMNTQLPILQLKKCLINRNKIKNIKGNIKKSAVHIKQKCFCSSKSMRLLYYLDICHNTIIEYGYFKNKTYERIFKEDCTIEKCCHNCKFAIGKICRRAKGECDISEKCKNGILSCGIDRFRKNYKSCNQKRGYCYYGDCVDLGEMCRIAYGTTKAYFSKTCAYYLNEFITIRCKRNKYAHLPTYMKNVCKP
ncbi:hypothetical protein HZS_4931, partial [Henneguya salminicola]